MRLVLLNIVRFIVLIAVQIFILNNVQLSGYINPYLYILFILILPFETPKWLLLFLSFFVGLTVDLFVHTPGMHAAACVLMAYLRPLVLSTVVAKRDYEPGIQPLIQDMGLTWFLSYAGILTLAHHTLLFFVEVFHFKEFFITIGRIFASSFFTIILVVVSQYVFIKPKKSNIVSGKI